MLVDIHPNYLEKNGHKEFVVLSIEEFQRIKETLEDYEDLIELRKVKSLDKSKFGLSISEVKSELGL